MDTIKLRYLYGGPHDVQVRASRAQRRILREMYRRWRTPRFRGGFGQSRDRCRSECLWEADQFRH